MMKSILNTINSVNSANYALSRDVRLLVSFWMVFPLVIWKFLQKALLDGFTESSMY